MNNCFICGKPTHNKLNNHGISLCDSKQCIWIFDNRESLKENHRTLRGEIEDLRGDLASLQGKIDALIVFNKE